MEIIILGKNSIVSKKELRYAANFFGEMLLGKRLAKNIYLEIENCDYPDHHMGYCIVTDIDYRNHREFTIELNRNLKYEEQIETLAHEMVHLKQYARNEWKEYCDGRHFWKGREIRVPKTRDQYNKAYWDGKLPWEKEAFLSEPWLCQFYEQHCENNNLTW